MRFMMPLTILFVITCTIVYPDEASLGFLADVISLTLIITLLITLMVEVPIDNQMEVLFSYWRAPCFYEMIRYPFFVNLQDEI